MIRELRMERRSLATSGRCNKKRLSPLEGDAATKLLSKLAVGNVVVDKFFSR